MWNTLTGEELLTLEGHKNVVYAIAFNNPFGDKIITGSGTEVDLDNISSGISATGGTVTSITDSNGQA